MSCGQHHETPCSEVLQAVVLFLDQEEPNIPMSALEQHLAECGPCCDQRDEIKVVKEMIARACCDIQVSQEIRLRITTTIVEIQAELPGGFN